jgi:RNA polymerase sigma-70 factor (ECF subfamily)
MALYINHTDEELVTLLRENSEDAFTALYDRYWKRLFVVAANKLQDLYVAEELVQDIFSDLWVRKETIELTGPIGVYLAVAMKYRVINYQARQRRAREYRLYAEKNLPSTDNSTQEWLRFEELKERLEELVAALPERCQLTYRMSREQGLTQKEIAREMGISEKAVERNMGRAIKTLKTGLGDMKTVFLPFL